MGPQDGSAGKANAGLVGEDVLTNGAVQRWHGLPHTSCGFLNPRNAQQSLEECTAVTEAGREFCPGLGIWPSRWKILAFSDAAGWQGRSHSSESSFHQVPWLFRQQSDSISDSLLWLLAIDMTSPSCSPPHGGPAPATLDRGCYPTEPTLHFEAHGLLFSLHPNFSWRSPHLCTSSDRSLHNFPCVTTICLPVPSAPMWSGLTLACLLIVPTEYLALI